MTALMYCFCAVCPGMSMFTTKNGLYERARSKFKIQDGMKLFSYPFYKQRRKDLQVWHPLSEWYLTPSCCSQQLLETSCLVTVALGHTFVALCGAFLPAVPLP